MYKHQKKNKMSKIKNVATITDDKVINVRRAAIDHRGRWAGAADPC